MKKILLIVFLLGTFSNLFSNKLLFKPDTTGNYSLTNKFINYSILTLDDSITSLGNSEFLTVKCNNDFYNFELKENRYLSQDYKLRTKSNNGIVAKSLSELDFDGHFYQNSDLSSGTAFLLSSFQEKYFIYLKDSASDFYIEPLSQYISNAPSHLYVKYNKGDAIIPSVSCGDTNSVSITQPVVELNGCFVTELAIACDYSMTQKYGTVNNILFRTINTLNLVSVDYKMANNLTDDVNFKIVEHYIVLCDTCNPWPYTSNINTNLTNVTANGPSLFTNPYDLAQYWFDFPAFGGGTIGLAWMNAVCGGYRYNAIMDFTPDYNSMRCLNSHEIGHNFSCAHDAQGATIMAPSMSGASAWSAQSINQIGNYLPTIGCLANCPTYQLCDTLGINNLNIIKDTINNKIVVKILPTGGISYRARLYSYQTGSWTPFNTFNAPVDSAFFNVNINTCSAKFKIEIAPICPVNIVGLSKIVVFDYQKAPVLSPLVTAAFNYSINSNSVNFTNTSTNATTAYWNFGNGQSSSLLNPSSIIYYTPGTFNVCLNAINNCIYNQTCQNITIAPQVKPFVLSVDSFHVVLNYPNGVNPSTINSSNIKIFSTDDGLKSGTFSIAGNNVTFTSSSKFRAGDELNIVSKNTVLNNSNTNYSSFVAQKYVPITNPTFALFDTFYTSQNIPIPTNGACDINYADFDKNGLVDVVSRRHDCYGCQTIVEVFLQISLGVFAPATTYTHGISHTFYLRTPDLNNDGYPDLVYNCNVPAQTNVWLNNGNGTFTGPNVYAIGFFGSVTEFADFNGDGYLDICALSSQANLPQNTFNILINNGAGVFSALPVIYNFGANSGMDISDYDKDGDIDVILTCSGWNGGMPKLFKYMNDGNANFILSNTPPVNPFDINVDKIEDFDNDGFPDILANHTNSTNIYKGDGMMNTTPSLFTPMTNFQETELYGDINGDSKLDMIALESYNGFSWSGPYGIKKYINNGNLNFTSTNLNLAFSSGLFHHRMVDIDNDGDVDFAYKTQDNKLCIAYNVNGNPCPPSIFISASSDSICAGQSITFTAIPTNPGPAPQYQWKINGANVGTNSAVFTTASLSNNDVVSCTLTSSAICAIPSIAVSNSIQITVDAYPSITINSIPLSAIICVGQSVQLTASGGSTYNWSGGINNGVAFYPSISQVYTVTVASPLGCSATSTKLITVNPLPTLTISSNPTNSTICLNQSITLTASGANTYSWSGGVVNGVPFFPASSGTYTVTGVSAAGCSATATKAIVVNANPVLSLSTNPANPTVCNGIPVQLTAGGASLYSWSPGAGLNSTSGPLVTAAPITTTTYTVTGTNVNGCTATMSQSVTINSLPTISISPNNASFCIGGNINLIAGGASSYSWSPSTGLNQTFGTNVIANPSTTTTYTVTGIDANGCSATNTKLVTVNALPTINVLPLNPAICLNQSVNLTAGGASSYVWSPATGLNQTTGTTVSASPTTTTTYTITGTDVNGCTNTTSNTVTVNALPTLSTTPSAATICIGDSVTLNVNGADTYTWSPNAGLNQSTGTQVKASPNSTTIYTITGTNANGCTQTQTLSVTVNPLPVLSALPANPAICFSESITLTANGAVSYTWSPATGLNNTATPSVLANPTTTQTYTITGTDANGCVNTLSTTLTVNPLPVLGVLPLNPSICIGDAVNMSVNGANTYLWSPASGLNTTLGNSVQANPTSTTTYQVVGTSALGCKDSITNTVIVNPLPVLVVSPISTTICQGQSTNLTVNGASTYVWTPGGSLNTAQGDSVLATPFTTTTYTIVGTDVNSCTSAVQILVNVNPSYNHFDTLELCQGMSYTFGSQTITTAGNYVHTFQTGLSCDSTVNLHVKVYDKPVANFTLEEHACVNEPVLIQNNWQSSQASYTWNVGDGILTGNTPSINVIWTLPGTKLVSLEVATQSPCIPELFIDTIQVHEAQAKIIVSDADTFFCIYDQVKLQTPNINGYSYLWSPSTYFNSTSFTAEGVVKEPVTVKVNVKDQWGCEAEDSKYLNVQPCCNAYLPNSFTPNGDGLNDVFRIIGEGNYRILDFYVANRWGNIIFRTIDQNVGWDGKIQGVEQSMDTYYYFLKYECANGEKRFIKGDLTLLR